MSDNETTIREVLAKHGRLTGDITTLDPGASLYAAGLTSHASVNLMLALEAMFAGPISGASMNPAGSVSVWRGL